MSTPLPSDDVVDLRPPEAAETRATACGVAAAVAPEEGLTTLQRLLVEALFPAMTGHSVEVEDHESMSPEELGAVLARRNLQFRSRGVQVMLLCALVLRPLPRRVVERVRAFAEELEVDDALIDVALRFADGALGLAAADFERNGYTADWSAEDVAELHTSVGLSQPWDVAVADAPLTARWAELGALPEGSLGRRVWELYRARGFAFPGSPGSAPPLLAQHDWVHVLADYGTTVASELEVFALIARANNDMRAFSLLAMVVSLFETGYLRAGAGLFESYPGVLSGEAGMAVRIGDAMYRGAVTRDVVTGEDSVDFLRIDWFGLAHLPVEEARARFSLPPISPAARAAGSVNAWEPGGISPFQLGAGREAAEREGRPYESYGART